jgi:hypothetical protein
MAAISTVTQILSTGIDLDAKTWNEITLGTDLHNIYAIIIKNSKVAKDTIDQDEIGNIIFELGIDSGKSDTVLSIGRFAINNFNEEIPYTFLPNLPTKFWIRPIQIIKKDGAILEAGKITSLALNVNPVNLGSN